MPEKNFQHFLDDSGQLVAWPSKQKVQLMALKYLSEKLEWDREYSEREINEILTQYHTFNDPALLRRELYMNHFLNRETNGTQYRRTHRPLPKRWNTERLDIQDTHLNEIPELQNIYDECAYIGKLTGYDDPTENPMLAEYERKRLPPGGKAEFYRLQSIFTKENHAPIGYLITYQGFPDPETFWITVLAIRPALQRQRLGMELLRGLEKEALELGTYKRIGISLGVGNEPARQFWTACGFTEVLKMLDHGTHAEQWRVKPLE